MKLVKATKSPDVKLTKRPAVWWRTFLYIAYYLGLRRGEIFGLTWSDVSLCDLSVSITATTSKGRKVRTVPMSRDLATILETWKKSQMPVSETAAVLPWPYDGYRQLYSDWHAIQAAAGIKDGEHYVPKNCRSGCASELIAAGVPTVVVKDFLGHESVKTTETYYINTTPALRSAGTARKVQMVDIEAVD